MSLDILYNLSFFLEKRKYSWSYSGLCLRSSALFHFLNDDHCKPQPHFFSHS